MRRCARRYSRWATTVSPTYARTDLHTALDGEPGAFLVSGELEPDVLDAQAQCAGECIYVKL